MLKRRQLRHQGWRLVSIPYWEWDELHNGGLAAESMDEREKKARVRV
jgi:hypothetical protein